MSASEDYRNPPATIDTQTAIVVRGTAHADTVAALVLLLGWLMLRVEAIYVESDALGYALLFAGLAVGARALVLYVVSLL